MKKTKSIIIKIQTYTFLFAWFTVILFSLFHPNLQSLTNELYAFLLATPLGILTLDPQNIKFDNERDYVAVPLLCVFTLWYDFAVWKFFITSFVNYFSM